MNDQEEEESKEERRETGRTDGARIGCCKIQKSFDLIYRRLFLRMRDRNAFSLSPLKRKGALMSFQTTILKPMDL